MLRRIDLEERIDDLNRLSGTGNLVFAKDGEEESEDEWDSDDDGDTDGDGDDDGDDDDGDDDELDPNNTFDAPQPPGAAASTRRQQTSDGRTSSSGGGPASASAPPAATFREDFQGTRVFVQGLPEEATWKDVSEQRAECV